MHTYDDHRMAMCLSLAAFNPLAGHTGSGGPGLPVRILDPRCVAKTFPDYFETLFGVVSAEPADVPVITVDGPTASGKGTLAAALAARLGYHMLDSGSLYRATALAALAGRHRARRRSRRWPGWPPCWTCASKAAAVVLRGRPVGDDLRREDVGSLASRVAALPAVREALHGLQLAFRRAAGTGRRRARHGYRDLSRRGAEGVPHRQRRATRKPPA